MSILIADLDLTCYNLPRDGAEAERDFLQVVHIPAEKWIAGFGFTLAQMIDEIEEDDAAGVAFHILLDLSQGQGHYEAPEITAIMARLKNSDVTFSTAGPLSTNPHDIMHRKTAVSRSADGGPMWCWSGSVNFSKSGWDQANDAFRFRSDAWAQDFIHGFFEPTRAWAKTHVKQVG